VDLLSKSAKKISVGHSGVSFAKPTSQNRDIGQPYLCKKADQPFRASRFIPAVNKAEAPIGAAFHGPHECGPFRHVDSQQTMRM